MGFSLGGFVGGLLGANPQDRLNNEFRDIDPNLGMEADINGLRAMAERQQRGPFASDIAAQLARSQGNAAIRSQAAGGRQAGGLAMRNAGLQQSRLNSQIAGQHMQNRAMEQGQRNQSEIQARGLLARSLLDRQNILQNARTQRFNAYAQTPTQGEVGASAIGAGLGLAGNVFGGGLSKKLFG